MNKNFSLFDFNNAFKYLKCWINNTFSHVLKEGKVELPYRLNMEFIVGILKLEFPDSEILVSDSKITFNNQIRIQLCDHDTVFVKI